MQLTHLVILSLILVPQLGFASVYTIDVGNHTYDVVYSVDADIIAMEIDPELNSLLVGLNNTKDSFFEIHLPDELISAEGDQFVVLIDWIETDYQTSQYLKEPDALTTVVEFFAPTGTIEIEIVGTSVIPEFPIGVVTVFAAVMTVTIIAFRRFEIFRW